MQNSGESPNYNQNKMDEIKIMAKARIKDIEQEEDTKNSEESSYDEDEQEEDVINFKNTDLIFNPESGLRNWLKSRGKEHCIDFGDEEMKQLRIYFNSLDDDGSGSIGTDELEDPLIALGLLDTRAQVDKIVSAVDDDDSGMLEFSEFLQIIKGGSKDTNVHQEDQNHGKKDDDDQSDAIYKFFKDLTQGIRKGGHDNENIPFSLYITQQRRDQIMKSMGIQRPQEAAVSEGEKKFGEKILNNYKRQVAEKLAREQAAIDGVDLMSVKSGKADMRSTRGMNSTFNSTKSPKKSEAYTSKLISQKLQEVSSFQGDVPDPDFLIKLVETDIMPQNVEKRKREAGTKKQFF